MSQNSSICIYSSQLSTIIGKNPYNKITDIIVEMWQRYYPLDYNNTIKGIEKTKNVKFVKEEKDLEKVKRIAKENNIDIKQDLKKCLKTETVNKLLTERKDLVKKIDKNKEEFKKALTNLSNTNFGTKHESSAMNIYCEKTSNKVNTPNTFFRKKIGEHNDTNWYIGGKIDGITEDNTLVEIKNRIYRLFYRLREYEKIQLYSYMFLCDTKKGHLVECSKNDTSKINIIEEEFDEEYWKSIEKPLRNFIKLFHHFMEDVNLKTLVLFGDIDNVEPVFMKIITGKQ